MRPELERCLPVRTHNVYNEYKAVKPREAVKGKSLVSHNKEVRETLKTLNAAVEGRRAQGSGPLLLFIAAKALKSELN